MSLHCATWAPWKLNDGSKEQRVFDDVTCYGIFAFKWQHHAQVIDFSAPLCTVGAAPDAHTIQSHTIHPHHLRAESPQNYVLPRVQHYSTRRQFVIRDELPCGYLAVAYVLIKANTSFGSHGDACGWGESSGGRGFQRAQEVCRRPHRLETRVQQKQYNRLDPEYAAEFFQDDQSKAYKSSYIFTRSVTGI